MLDKKENHRKFAKETFNGTWNLLDKKERTKEEDAQMIRMAHASRYHWGEIGTPLEFARSDWQISRVYAVLGFGVMAHKYAKTSLEHCEKNEIGDFDLAFAYEALARASAVSGDTPKGYGYLSLAESAGSDIAKKDDSEFFLNELKTVTELL
ncbi:MAG: hypothetical protein HN392_06080 [Anaerolineae bacterium]|mgnify:CR=1 FL=1|jgi:hypothetical protein|nr:hypothetical protein [Anaerolineae bacterium]MBT7073752.1 hypothetical protein [Anaerolineae bacterium]MBT7782186.1 hypothetical protein [Anaerolineae bacterium]